MDYIPELFPVGPGVTSGGLRKYFRWSPEAVFSLQERLERYQEVLKKCRERCVKFVAIYGKGNVSLDIHKEMWDREVKGKGKGKDEPM